MRPASLWALPGVRKPGYLETASGTQPFQLLQVYKLVSTQLAQNRYPPEPFSAARPADLCRYWS